MRSASRLAFPQLLALLAITCPSRADGREALPGRVVGVTDGDSLTVLVACTRIQVRLAEIDTPERG